MLYGTERILKQGRFSDAAYNDFETASDFEVCATLGYTKHAGLV